MTLEELLQLLEPIIIIKARQATIHSMEWEDVAQELRIVVIQKKDLFLNGKSAPQTFAKRVFRNRIIELWRQAKSRPEFESEDILTEKCEMSKNMDKETLERMCLNDGLIGLLTSFDPETRVREVIAAERQGDIDLVKMFQACILSE